MNKITYEERNKNNWCRTDPVIIEARKKAKKAWAENPNEELMKLMIKAEEMCVTRTPEKDRYYWYYLSISITGCKGETCSCKE